MQLCNVDIVGIGFTEGMLFMLQSFNQGRLSLWILMLGLALISPAPSLGSCGSVSCFVTIGSQQQVPQQGLLTTNFIYSYTPMTLPSGSTGVIAEVNQTTRRIINAHHRELSTITNSATFDANYGITDRLGLQLTVPYLQRNHEHHHWDNNADGALSQFADKGIGDVRVTAKYNVLPSLRNMLVLGLGVDLPTGDHNQIDRQGNLLEPSGQLGRGQPGLIGSAYQAYELIPHRLNQFTYVSYRRTFRDNEGYKFGDEYILNAGFNVVPADAFSWLTVTAQLNYRYLSRDTMEARLTSTGPIGLQSVPNSGSSWLGAAPGVLVSLADTWQAYFFGQIPLVRDANNNLAQATSYTFGVTKFFQLGGQSGG